MKKLLLLLPFGLALAVLLSACGGYSIPSDQVAIQEGRGAEAKKVKGCKASNERAWFGNDEYFQFPTNEREWVAAKEGGDSGRFGIVSKDSVEMLAPVTLQFNMITDCETLKEFWTKHGKRNQAYFDEDGEYTDGWMRVLQKLVAAPADSTFERIAQKYNWREMWNDPAVKVQIENEMKEAVNSENSLLVQRAQGQYFEDFSVVIGKIEPKNEELATAVAAEQTAVAKAQSAEAQAEADKAAAQAQIAVSEAIASKKRAEIDGYGSIENYLKYLCLTEQTNCNPYQPTYVYGAPPK